MSKELKTKNLGEICSFLNRGVSPKYIEKGGIVVLNQKCIRDHRVEYSLARRHDVKAKTVSSERMLQAGDVLINSTGTGTLGRVAQLRTEPSEPTTVDSHVTIARSKPGLFFLEFFGYMLRDIEEELKESGEGCGGQTELNRSVLAEKFVVRFPNSLAEQQRIVGILDEAFAGLATAKATAEKNLQNARALFESHLQSVFTQRGEGWVETTIGDDVEFAAGFAFKSTRYIQDAKNGTRLLRGDNIMQGEFRWEDAVYWPTEDTIAYERFRLEESDIVLAMDRPWVAAGLKIAYISSDDLPSLQVQRTARLRVSNRLSWRYLFHLLRSQKFVSYLLDGQTGLGVPHISGKQILAFRFSRPSLAEQLIISKNLDALSTETQRLAAIYQQKLLALQALKKSLLHQAFRGEL